MAQITPVQLSLKDGTCCAIHTTREADADGLHAHLQSVAHDGAYIVTLPDEVPTPEELRRKIARHNRSPNDLNLVAVLGDGAIIGDLLATGGDRRRVSHKIRFGLSVAKEFRDRGVGRALIGVMLEWARAHPAIEKVDLGVFASNSRARHLYTSLGFKEEGRRVKEIKVGPGDYEDDIAMALFLK